MACSICKQMGHNKTTCPQTFEKKVDADKNTATHALWIKYDQITEKQANELITANMDAKQNIAPDGRGTFVKADAKKLPSEIKKALSIEASND